MKAIPKKYPIALGLGFFIYCLLEFATALNQKIDSNDPSTLFEVQKGEGLNEIIQNLDETFNLRDEFWIRLNIKFFWDEKVFSGRYNIKPDESLRELLSRISSGDIKKFRFTIIEGTTSKTALEKLIKIITDEKLKISLSNEVKNIFSSEANILPDTYFFSGGEDLNILIQNSKRVLKNYLLETWRNKPKDNPLKTIEEALVLASIIEREAFLNEERQKIASVFLKRLSIGMRLQSDPTSSYGFYGGYGKKIGKDVLRDNNAYNTYRIQGLPPEPICFPSKESIFAAITSSPGQYLFFVAKGDGSHVFSKNYDDHNKAVKKYIYSK